MSAQLRVSWGKVVLLVALVAATGLLVQRIAAQEGVAAQDLLVQVSGIVTEADSATAIVNGRLVDVSAVPLPVPLQPGTNVQVTGVLATDGRLIAREILIRAGDAQPQLDPRLQPGPAPTQELADCVFDALYWRDHVAEWRVNGMVLGSQLYTGQDLVRLLHLTPGSDPSVALAQELVAANLNIAAGAVAPDVAPTLFQADSLLSNFLGRVPLNLSSDSTDAPRFDALSAALRSFNTSPAGVTCSAAPMSLAPQATPETLAPGATPPAATAEVQAASAPSPLATPEVTDGDTLVAGTISEISGTSIVVSGMIVRLQPGDPLLSAGIGARVRVIGNLQADGTLLATSTQVLDLPSPVVTPEVGPPAPALAPASTPEVFSSSGGFSPVATPEVLAPAFTPEVDDNSGMGSANSGMGSSDVDDDSDDDDDFDDDGDFDDDDHDDDISGMGT